MEMTQTSSTLFDPGPGGMSRQVVLPWKRTLGMCLSNVRNRLGRSSLTFAGIVIVVAFFMSSLSYQTFLAAMMEKQDVHTKAILERAGVVTHDPVAMKNQTERRQWLLGLSALLCLAGITNTMLMSVTERFREIGTLKCLGALDRFVVRLFLVESFFIGLLGSLSGTLLGYLLAVLQVAAVLEIFLVPVSTYGGTFVTCAPIAVGAGTLLTVLAAVYPTYVAAKMKPVDAMRSEL